MVLIFKTFVLGVIIGVIFTLFGLEVPAPNNTRGIVGIIGLFVGGLLINKIK